MNLHTLKVCSGCHRAQKRPSRTFKVRDRFYNLVALVVGKIAERKTGISLRKMVEQLKLIRVATLLDTVSGREFSVTSDLTEEQKRIYDRTGVKLPRTGFV